MNLCLSKKFFNQTDYLSDGYKIAFNPSKNKLTFYKSEKADKKITDLQQIAIRVNGLQKPTFSEIAEYLNCHKKIEAINQFIERKKRIPIDLKSFCLSTFETVLNQWCSEDPKFRVSAKEKIWNFYTSSERTILDLSCLNLTSLPNIFHLEPFQSRLVRLNLTSNKLTNLPDSLGNLSALTYLDLSYNKLISLPDSLDNLLALKNLDLSSNKLTNLPDSLGNLSALTYLNLSYNELTSLPDSLGKLLALTGLLLSHNKLISLPDSLGNLRVLTELVLNSNQLVSLPYLGNLIALTYLVLSHNKLTSLPDFLGSLSALIDLDLSCNKLANLPDSFGNLPTLTHLNLSDNELVSLPDSLGNLRALRYLNLSFNFTLSGLSIYILNLSRCTIDLTGCNLSQRVLENIRRITTDPTYVGPRISFSISDRNHREEKSVEESLKDLCDIANKPFFKFSNLKETPEKILTLRSWLNRLSDIADYQKQGDLQKAFVNKILEYLELADKDPVFREAFYCVIEDASTTCGDRVTLSVLYLSVAHKLQAINHKNIKAVANFLIKGPWTIELLEEIARNKILSLPLFDEIEVYLGYPIKLKRALHIPIDVQEMLYFRCSALKDEDLKEAKDFVLSKQQDQKARFEFLINHDKWKEALSTKYEEEYKTILDKKTKASESDHPDYKAIKEEFNQALMGLTEKALAYIPRPLLGKRLYGF